MSVAAKLRNASAQARVPERAEAGRTERHSWHELWRYRELFRVLAWRDISVRYKQTAIGAMPVPARSEAHACLWSRQAQSPEFGPTDHPEERRNR